MDFSSLFLTHTSNTFFDGMSDDQNDILSIFFRNLTQAIQGNFITYFSRLGLDMLVFFLCVPSDLWWFLLFRDESSEHFVRSLYRITTSQGLSCVALEVAHLCSFKGTRDVDRYIYCVLHLDIYTLSNPQPFSRHPLFLCTYSMHI